MAAESAEDFIERKSSQWERERHRPVKTKDVGRQGWHLWVREAWTWHVQNNHREKVFVIERLRLQGRQGERAYDGGAEPGDIEYRFGYYIVGRIGRAAGRWTWGQYSPFIPQGDLATLLAKARSEGTLLG